LQQKVRTLISPSLTAEVLYEQPYTILSAGRNEGTCARGTIIIIMSQDVDEIPSGAWLLFQTDRG